MTAAFALRTMIEFAVVLLLIYGLFHEKKLIRLEDRILRFIARRVRRAHENKRLHEKARRASLCTDPKTPGGRSDREPRRVA